MELVDANTKNYVFLTLSQYNAEQDLVRTRVSMRRDQPFWDGGNSYICCESFRVTSSPSQGGLYYKIFPYDWYMGCKIPQNRDEAPANDDANWESSITAAAVAQAPLDGIMFMTGGGDPNTELPTIHQNGTTVTTDLYTWGQVPPNAVPALLQTQDPLVIRSVLESYVNPYFLGNQAWVRLNQSTGSNGNQPGYIIGRCKGDPSKAITGNGLGIDKLYYPAIDVAYPTPTLASLGVLGTLTEAQAVNNPFTLQFKMLAQPNAGYPDMQAPEYNSLLNNMGDGLHIQVRTSHEHPRDWSPVVYGGIWNVLGVEGVHYEFQQQFFFGSGVAPNTTTRGDCSGPPLRPMRYNEFKVGAECWIDIGADDPTFLPGRFEGKITVVPPILQNSFGDEYMPGYSAALAQTYLQLNLHLQATPVLWTLITAGGDNAPLPTLAREAMLAQKWLISTDNKPLNASIRTHIEFEIEEKVNNNNPFQDAAVVEFAANRNAHNKLCIRRPNKYIFTPNEMFYAFNRKDHNVGHLPYKIQTDENGGFCIYWRPAASKAHSFVISVGLSTALGLNNFFEYDWDEYTDDAVHNLVYLKKAAPGTHQDEDISIWLDHDAIRLHPDLVEPVPIPVPAGINGAPLQVWDLDGNEYTYIRSYQYREKRFQTIKRYVNPTVHTDEDGTQYYRYNNLPGDGEIRNTEMVSVESFSTYSEITLVIPNLPFQSMLGTSSDERILASLRLPFENGTNNDSDGQVATTTFSYYGDLIFNTLASRSYLKVTTDQALYDCDVEVRLIRRDGQMDVMQLPYQGEFQVKIRLLQTQ